MWSTFDYMPASHRSQRGAPILQLVTYSDADFADCVETLRSTMGGHVCLDCPLSQYPIHALSTRQNAIVSATLEAESVAAYTVCRTMLIPCLHGWGVLLQRWNMGVRGIPREDIAAAIRVIQSGRNPTVKHLHRVHGVNIAIIHAFLWEQCERVRVC